MTTNEDQDRNENTLDIIISGGHVIDPANGLDARMEVGIKGGKIAQVAGKISSRSGAQVIDVSGLYVTPGILDIHTHVYKFRPQPGSYIECVNPDAHLLASGVTTTVDAGTAGWKHFLDFKTETIDKSRVRVLALINIASSGMVDAASEQVESEMQPEIVASVARAFPETIVGVKSAHYWTREPWDDAHHPWTSVEKALEGADRCGKLLMVDFWPRPLQRSYQDLILRFLRPGDIHTHVFAQQFPILDGEGQVSDFLLRARERGVIFDLGHGAASFWFRNAVPAFRQGFPPDTLSTDLHMGNINGPVISMQNIMSKFLNMGMPLVEVIRRSTSLPAHVISRPDLGTLSVGADADLAVFERLEGTFGYSDCGRARMSGSQKLECRLTLRAGQVLFDPSGLSMPEWEQAPEAYWKIPELQS